MSGQIVYGFTGDCLAVNGDKVGCKFRADSTTNIIQVRAKTLPLGTTSPGPVDDTWATLTHQNGTNCYFSNEITLDAGVTPGYQRQNLDDYRFTIFVRVERMLNPDPNDPNAPTSEWENPVPADPIAIAGMPGGCDDLIRGLTPNPRRQR